MMDIQQQFFCRGTSRLISTLMHINDRVNSVPSFNTHNRFQAVLVNLSGSSTL